MTTVLVLGLELRFSGIRKIQRYLTSYVRIMSCSANENQGLNYEK